MNNSFKIQKLRDRRHKLMYYRQVLTNRLDDKNNKTTLGAYYAEMENYDTKCAIATIKRILK